MPRRFTNALFHSAFLQQRLTNYHGFSSIDEAKFDMEEAIYWFATDYHGGQASNLYAALCLSAYNPGPLQSSCTNDGAYDLLQDLIEHFESNPAR
jgi:hypothetical protein